MTKSIRYRYALLLMWAAVALVTNPVWHAAGHLFSEHASDHTFDHTDHAFDTQWVQEDVCLYCDGVSQVADAPTLTTLYTQFIRVGNILPLKGQDADLSPLLTTRLRAPPVLA